MFVLATYPGISGCSSVPYLGRFTVPPQEELWKLICRPCGASVGGECRYILSCSLSNETGDSVAGVRNEKRETRRRPQYPTRRLKVDTLFYLGLLP
jgi:hypothetical protein